MCGIIGMISKTPFHIQEPFMRLKKLEYRGYDSYGYYDKKIFIKKVGSIKIPDQDASANLAILHTRWATHGGVTEKNAHPHQSCDKNITIVHNGILENYEDIKKELIQSGHSFVSETDSEVIAHYFEEKLKTKSMSEACKDFIKEVKGTFAILIIKQDEDKIYALRRDSPLVLGTTENQNILASDIYAFSDITNQAIFFDNDEFAIIEKDSFQFFDKDGKQIQKEIKTFVWDQEETGKQEYPHYMIKEIMEEPLAARRLLLSLENEQKESLQKLINLIKTHNKIVFVACGTSYHASLLGVYYLHQCGKESQALIASEFENFAFLDDKSLVIAVSQSGETMDVIEALKYSKSQGAKIASIVNVPYSTIQRMSEVSINIAAGQEVCVASTKAFVNQVALLVKIAQEFGFKMNLNNLPERIQQVLDQKDKIQKIAEEIASSPDMYILGRGLSYPVAREVALKIKEITYIHAEGMMGGELKHGTLALIEPGTPVISLISNNNQDMVSNTKEVEARGAKIIRITNELAGDIKIETYNDGKFAILACIVGQLIAYYIGLKKGVPIDKPRNLAKSVTVK